MNDKKFGNKEYFITAVGAFYILVFALFYGLPTFITSYVKGDKRVYEGGKTIIDYLLYRESRFIISGSVVIALSGLAFLAGLYFFIRSITNYKDAGDKEDKSFIISTVFFMISLIIVALYSLTGQQYIPMAIGLVPAALGFLFMYLHYKRFTDY